MLHILGQFVSQYHLQEWEQNEVEFKTYLYGPEVHPEKQEVFCKREDKVHVPKVYIGT